MIPQKTYMPGWPERLTDNEGNSYVRLRDGKPSGQYVGECCLYGLVLPGGLVSRAHQWVPTLGSTEDDMRLSGGAWISAEELVSYGQTPIEIPQEPIAP